MCKSVLISKATSETCRYQSRSHQLHGLYGIYRLNSIGVEEQHLVRQT